MLDELTQTIGQCTRCPRLRAYCKGVAQKKKRAFQKWVYWGRPVPGFGDPNAKLWIVGLAPAAHGANRTGRMFTGDSSGDWLYRALFQQGFANQPLSRDRMDGLTLEGVYVSAALRCAPPDNKPIPEELKNCASYLDDEYGELRQVKVLLALGKTSFQSIRALLRRHDLPAPNVSAFAHGAEFDCGEGKKLLVSYHPSRQNTNTGKLTAKMWQEIFMRARNLCDEKS